MIKAYKYRLNPTEAQKVLLEKHFGCVRFVYNLGLETRIAAYSGKKKGIPYYELTTQLTQLKNDCTFLNEVSATCLEASLKNLEMAYKAYFKKTGKQPNYKSKRGRQSFRVRVACNKPA